MIEEYLRQIDELLSTSPTSGRLIKRWDNAPHHPELDTFPHHLHEGDRVVSHSALNALESLQHMLAQIEASGGASH